MSGAAERDDSTDEVHIDFSETVHIDGLIEVSFRGPLPYFSEPQIEDITPLLQFSAEIPDDRAEWHHNYTPIESWMLAHIYREVNGWNIKQTADRLVRVLLVTTQHQNPRDA